MTESHVMLFYTFYRTFEQCSKSQGLGEFDFIAIFSLAH